MRGTQLTLAFPADDTVAQRPVALSAIDTTFPEEDANRLAHVESFNKHLFRPNTYLHKWWARRSGTTFRHILKQLVPAEHKRDYYTAGGLEGMRVLDPMMGGGTIIHEAIRLGANVIGYDIDPIPVLQARASLSSIPLSEKQAVFEAFRSELSKAIEPFYRTQCPSCSATSDIQFLLYGLRRTNQGGEVVVVDSFVLREEANGSQVLLQQFYPSRDVIIRGRTLQIVDRLGAREIGATGKTSEMLEVPFFERYVPLVLVGLCPTHGSFFKAVDPDDCEQIGRAREWVREHMRVNEGDFPIPAGPKSDDLRSRNVRTFLDLFYPRQLVYLTTAINCVRTLPKVHALWLSLLVSTSLEFNCALCGYKGADVRRPGAIRHVFSHHAYSFPYTSLENNPIFPKDTSGTLGSLFETRILGAGEWANSPIERRYSRERWEKVTIFHEVDHGTPVPSVAEMQDRTRCFIVRQNDSTRMPIPSESVDYVVTDPPYFDSVQYSDLSHFFRCWLRALLPDEADWSYNTDSSAVAETAVCGEKYADLLGRIWQECNRVLVRPHGRLVFTFHHWRPDAWAQLTNALRRAEFRLVNYFVVHSENPTSVHIVNLRALTHDTVLVLKPSSSELGARWERPESVSGADSYGFCKACGEMIGWALESGQREAEVLAAWTELIGG